ncbi:MAG: sugar ABC transporter permease [Candidatus Thorarchaeota archaeon]|nr:MAG: sugar ABC transporter permease [Candidatus Thorarchaeota archaeon]
MMRSTQPSFEEERKALPFLIPALLVLCLISLYPLIQGISRMFYTYQALTQKTVFVGLQNVKLLFSDHLFLRAFTNSLVWTGVSVIMQFILSYWLATMLNSRFLRLRRMFRGITIIPWALPPVVIALMWRYIFLGNGPLNMFLHSLGVAHPPNWLTEPRLALWTCIIANIWMGIPFVTVMLLAGLQTIDKNLLDAAAIDGANYLQMQYRIIIPSVKKVILIILTLETIWTFNMFDIVFVLTKGGPGNASLTLPLYAYENAFMYYQPGYGATIGMFILLCLLTVVVLYIREVLR